MRTKLFWTGPFGFGGVIGTGTTACAGGLAFDGTAGNGPCGPTGGGAGVPCCAYDVDPSSNARQTKKRARFMGGKVEKSNEVIENQDWNLQSQVTLGQNRHNRCPRRSTSLVSGIGGWSVFVPFAFFAFRRQGKEIKFQRDRELI
jgi:hypothetical protein